MFGSFDYQIPGWVRLFHPQYRQMVKQFMDWIKADPNGRCLTVGPWAKKDMLRLGVPEEKIFPWGYFVMPPASPQLDRRTSAPSTDLRILWVGRMIYWKRVDVIIKAFGHLAVSSTINFNLHLTLIGDGPEKSRLRSLASQVLGNATSLTIEFLPSQPIDKIREIMRAHDVYVLSSDAQEGWGAALNEALEEGMVAVGTYEAGSSATMLDEQFLYHADDWQRLAALLVGYVRAKQKGVLCGQGIGEWSAERAAERILAL